MTTATAAGDTKGKKAKPDGAAVVANPGTPVVTTKEKTPVQTVKMTDGRTVDFPGKRKMQKESYEGDNGQVSVRLDFVNGGTRRGAEAGRRDRRRRERGRRSSGG
jgi:hypothetical protein